jgi:hypothetical protein
MESKKSNQKKSTKETIEKLVKIFIQYLKERKSMVKKIFKTVKDHRGAIIIAVLFFAMLPNFINLFFQYVKIFFLIILKNENIGNLLQGLGLALLTILIPLAISVLQAFLKLPK